MNLPDETSKTQVNNYIEEYRKNMVLNIRVYGVFAFIIGIIVGVNL